MFAQSNFFGLSIVSIAIYYKLHGRIMMPKVGKKHFAYTEKGKKKAKDYAKKVDAKLQEVGTVGALAAQRKRERDPSDFLSVGKRSTKRASNVGLETQAQRAASNLKLKQQQQTGKMGGGATNILVKRRLGIAAGTEMNWKNKLVEMTPSQARAKATAADVRTVHSKKPFELVDLLPGRDPGAGRGKATAKEKIHTRAVSDAKKRIAARDDAKSRDDYSRQKNRELKSEIEHNERERTQRVSRRRTDRSGLPPVGTKPIAAGTQMNWTHKLVEHLIVEKDWIQGAVNPAHKGFCSPMTKGTCTPARKALAKRFKKAGRKEKRSGGTGWEGKV
jgi:hypothetical protein